MNLASPEHKKDPYPFYTRLREEAPVCRVPLTGKQTAWLVTRYADVAAAFKDARFVKDKRNAQTRRSRSCCAPRVPWKRPRSATPARTWRSPAPQSHEARWSTS